MTKFEQRMAFIAAYQGDILLDVQEVKMVLGTSNDGLVYDLIRLGLLPHLVVGSKKVRRSTLDKFLEKYDGVDVSALIKEKKSELK